MADPQQKPARIPWESLAERRLREAIEAGQFKDLPGFGRPIPDIDEVWDENSWVRKKLQREEIRALPPILEARLRIERFQAELTSMATESEVQKRLAALNDFVRAAHFSHIAGPADGVRPLDEAEVLREWRKTRAPQTGTSPQG